MARTKKGLRRNRYRPSRAFDQEARETGFVVLSREVAERIGIKAPHEELEVGLTTRGPTWTFRVYRRDLHRGKAVERAIEIDAALRKHFGIPPAGQPAPIKLPEPEGGS